MLAMALSCVGARMVESGPGGSQELAAGMWQKLEALPDPRSPRGRVHWHSVMNRLCWVAPQMRSACRHVL